MTGSILLFGRLKDAFGADRLRMPDGVVTVADLRAVMLSAHPDLADRLDTKSMRIAVNQELIADESRTVISPGDEVALLPPLSGG